jgi:hypothetical protein
VVEAAWAIVEPILDDVTPVYEESIKNPVSR